MIYYHYSFFYRPIFMPGLDMIMRVRIILSLIRKCLSFKGKILIYMIIAMSLTIRFMSYQ